MVSQFSLLYLAVTYFDFASILLAYSSILCSILLRRPKRRGKSPRRFFPLRFQSVPDNLAGPPDAFFIGVGIHPQRHRRITVAQALRHADYIGPVCQRNRTACMPELVGVEILNAISLAKL